MSSPPVKDLVTDALGDRSHLRAEVRGHAEFGQAFAQKFDDSVNVAVVQPVLYQVGVAGAHVLPGVGDRASEDHRQESFLLADLPVHIDAVEEAGDPVVDQHRPIEDNDRCIHRGSATALFVKSHTG